MMDILKRIDFVQQFANEYADGSWSIDTEKWRHHVTPEFIEDVRQYIVSLQLKLMHEQSVQAKPYTYLWEADGTCEAVKGHVSVSSNTGPAHGWKVTPLFTHPAPPATPLFAGLIAAHDGLADELKAQQVAVPSGWALVPVESTEEMISAGQDLVVHDTAYEDYRGVYKAMLAAAQGAKPVTKPDSRPQNCGTNHCSCIVCPYVKPTTGSN